MRAATAPPRRLLVVLDHPGALLHFDETVRELVSRDHKLHLAFLRPGKYADALGVLGEAADRITLHLEPPVRRDRHSAVAAWVRAITDYVHYLDPAMAGARYSRNKWLNLAPLPARARRRLASVTSAPAPAVRFLLLLLTHMEAAIPPPHDVEAFVRDIGPDAVIVSPLVDHHAHQTDYLRAASTLGIPTALLVTSWDNLTSKGRIRVVPDRVVVWNETQRAEAICYHGVDRTRLVLTGAQQFDRWFDRAPSSGREEFLRRFELPADRPFVLFTCSTRQGTPREAEPEYVRRWLTALRRSDDPTVRGVSVLIRPHPTAVDRWNDVDLADLAPARLWNRDRPLPIAGDDRAEYFDALYHCAALVAINSTSMIEATIVDRPVHTIAIPDFALMQHDLMHFHYLRRPEGGFLRETNNFDEHARLLAEDIRDPDRDREVRRRFVNSFIRPRGEDRLATDVLVEEMLSIPDVVPDTPARPTVAGRLMVAALSIAISGISTKRALTDGAVASLSDRTSRLLTRRARALGKGRASALAPVRTTATALKRLADTVYLLGGGSRRRLRQ